MAPIPKEEYGARIREEAKTGGFWRDIFSEFLATFLFVTMSTMLRLDPTINVLQLGIGVAFLWAALGYGLGDFGGAHMNSAITMAMMIRGEITIIKAIFYWILQTAGGLAAYYFVSALGSNAPIPGFAFFTAHWWQGMLVEALITMVLCLAALGTGNIPRKGYIILQSIPVALAAGVGTIIAFLPTRACMSPTQALAHQIWDAIENQAKWTDHWHYWAGPMIGAVAAAIFYWIFDVIDRPTTQPGVYNTWTYADAKGNKPVTSSKERLTNGRRDDDDYPHRSPPHHAHHGGYNQY